MALLPIPDKGTLCTGDTVSPQMARYSFLAPDDLWIQEAIFGMVWDLAGVERWTACGTVTIEQAADIFTKLFESLTMSTDQIGTIVLFAGTIPLGGQFLPCDGATYNISDFPALFAIISNVYGGDGVTTFAVPDLRSSVPMGAGQRPGHTDRNLGDFTGNETETLSVGEMPPHTHSESGAAPSVVSIAAGVPVTVAVSVPAITGTTGGGGAHNNMQPSLAVNYAILAK